MLEALRRSCGLWRRCPALCSGLRLLLPLFICLCCALFAAIRRFYIYPSIYIQAVYFPLLRRFSARGGYLCGGARITSRNFYPVLPQIVVYPDDRKASEGLFGSRRLFLRFL